MPSSEVILAGLNAIANQWRLLAIFWHGYFIVLLFGLVFGVRPRTQRIGLLLVLPLFSVGILAWLHGNPFNGTAFALTGIVLAAIAVRSSREAVTVAPAWVAVPGALMVGFGWIYPHFLDNATPLEYLYAAPTGLIPCPTLSIVIGFTLLLGGLRSRTWCLVLAIMGLFYGVFGAVRLGVTLDGVLLFGALATAYVAFSPLLRTVNVKGTVDER
ncbi:hypothetical protein MSNKSG1_14212 [Marinobacter santoriniensis NKSG1]|uniref:Uncharacterized protein n=1 Tax=Marinobacter santoriniensis NKSG1 TaxID=1288826 RepID=M7DB49_9GAMM|nr:hypothetical protein [Marinobacter santoriniensis]EMP54892.1 hypothetical protein MSNKSG1_14212 [Marinobacter santoriniensis NKSG1]